MSEGFLAQMRAKSGDRGKTLDKLLNQFADRGAVARAIENDFSGHRVTRAPLQVAEEWCCYARGKSAAVCRLDSLVWAYGDQAISTNDPLFSKSQIALWPRSGEGMNLQMSRADAEEGMERIARAAPWLAVGYDAALRETWNNDRESLIATVDRARAEGRSFGELYPGIVDPKLFKQPTLSVVARISAVFGAILIIAAAIYADQTHLVDNIRDAVQLSSPFDVGTLDHGVAEVVARARENRTLAEVTAAKAREAAAQAQREADAAANQMPGTRIVVMKNGDKYFGEWARHSANGAGVLRISVPEPNGVASYAGNWADGARTGYGVTKFANEKKSSAAGVASMECKFQDGTPTGFGVLTQSDGSQVEGSVDWEKAQAAGLRFTDGTRYEGEEIDGAPSGRGVLWTARGQIKAEGIWTQGELTTPLGKQGP